MPKQEFRQFGVWPETHRAFKQLSFENEKPIARLACEAVQLLKAHYAQQSKPAAHRSRATAATATTAADRIAADPQPTTAA